MIVVVVNERVIGECRIERFLFLLALREFRSKHAASFFGHADGCSEGFRSQVLYCAACASIKLLLLMYDYPANLRCILPCPWVDHVAAMLVHVCDTLHMERRVRGLSDLGPCRR
jgi:hypothetical protein